MTDKSNRDLELAKRLNEAEEILDALRSHKVDAVIGTNQVAMLRLKQVEDQLHEQVQIAENRLREIESIYRNVPVGLGVLNEDLRFVRVNEHLARMNGIPLDEHLGKSLHELLPKLAQDVETGLRKVIKSGKSQMDLEIEGETPAHPGMKRHWLHHWLPLYDQQGKVIGINMVIDEVTERKKTEQTQRLLLGELNHRIKNNIATIQAIADQTLQQSEKPSDFVESFKGRLQTLARSHTLLTRSKWKGAGVEDIIQEQLILAEKNSNIQCEGDQVVLPPQTALHFALVLHELGTNARKYGALSVPEGRLNVNWQLQSKGDGEVMKLNWEEQNGPGITHVDEAGFGMTLIKQSLKSVGGVTEINFDASGLRCEIILPVSEEETTLGANDNGR